MLGVSSWLSSGWSLVLDSPRRDHGVAMGFFPAVVGMTDPQLAAGTPTEKGELVPGAASTANRAVRRIIPIWQTKQLRPRESNLVSA